MARLLKIDPQVKAIVSSGYSDDPVRANFQTYGFTDVIAKPYRISELYRVLKKTLVWMAFRVSPRACASGNRQLPTAPGFRLTAPLEH